MEIKEYFNLLSEGFEKANKVAGAARGKGYDPETFVEIKAAPDLASRVEGIIGVHGLAEIIKSRSKEGKSRQELAFEIVKEICTNTRFEMELQKRLTLAVRVGLSILTEGILVAPTEGLQGVELHKYPDGSDYVAVVYAGPIRGAGGTSAALSVALADYARRIFNIGQYRATQSEVERYVEEMLLYHSRCARLQYLPTEKEMKVILENCPVCVDGLPTEEIEVSIHRNLKRMDATGKEQPITNRVRGGIGLVVCEGIAQKAKSVLKTTKAVSLDWTWLNGIIKVDKGVSGNAASAQGDSKKNAVFLQELVAGRPVFSYPDMRGGFRLRYGRSRLTGIAAKGFSPATMQILDEFIATGTQVKVEKPGKGCIATPVDSIEGPFVKLANGDAFRVNDAETAKAVMGSVSKILAVGDMLISYGDFKKTNTPLQPSSYVEEMWVEQLKQKGYTGEAKASPSFKEAYEMSAAYGVPMHPRYIYDYADLTIQEAREVAEALLSAKVEKTGSRIFDVVSVEVQANNNTRNAIEKLCIPHKDNGSAITIKDNDAQSLLSSFGFSSGGELSLKNDVIEKYASQQDIIPLLNSVAPFAIIKRSTRIGARMGRPEKARERLMKPAPHVLFPIGEYGGKERNIYKAYVDDKKRFGMPTIEADIAMYVCTKGGEPTTFPYCTTHNARAELDRRCKSCGRKIAEEPCPYCGGKERSSGITKIDIIRNLDDATKRVKIQTLPKVIKGVKGLVSKDKIAEPLEKGVLRSAHNIYIFKDGTSRFDATDTPMTHFYPREIKVSAERLRAMGYQKDCDGNPLERDDQLVELRHQDVILNKRGGEYLLRVAGFIDDLLVKYYGLEPYYNAKTMEDMLGQNVITLSPHTSCGVLGRIIGFTDANVGFAHPYTITARRRNCDGDEDTTMLLLDALINFSKKYLPVTIGGTMDAPLILTVNVLPEEVDDEVHAMEVVKGYGLQFYEKTFERVQPGDVQVELVANRLKDDSKYQGLNFTHGCGPDVLAKAPVKSAYTKLKTMQEKIDLQFKLMDRLCTVDRQDTARKLILSHFIPDLIGNMHSFSKQTFRCVNCNSKYRRIPLTGKCKRCSGKLVLTISKGGIEKYLNIAITLADRYKLEPYITQRLKLIKEEIENVLGGIGGGEIPTKQFNLANYM
jgi:DNA polymerase II large subunit